MSESGKDDRPVPPPTTPSKSEESRTTKFLRVACSSTLEKIVSSSEKELLVQLYGPVVNLRPSVVEQLHTALVKVVKNHFLEGLDNLINGENLDAKFRALEALAEEKKDGGSRKKMTPAWRPTGLRPEQQLLCHDAIQQELLLVELRAAVAAKEKEVASLRKQLVELRSPCSELEHRLADVQAASVMHFDTSQEVAERVQALQDEI